MTNNQELLIDKETELKKQILLIDKPPGFTAFDVVKIIRRFANIRKVGHTGSLDPFASGLMIVCSGNATKLIETFMSMPKEYEAVFVLGKTTDTYDCEGKIISQDAIPPLTIEDLKLHILPFIGTIYQIPPMFSALKYKGVALYKYARKGEFIPRATRPVTIYDFNVLWFQSPRMGIQVRCSKGTYIRSLAHDLGIVLGCGAYVESLRRTKIGEYSVHDALPLERFREHCN